MSTDMKSEEMSLSFLHFNIKLRIDKAVIVKDFCIATETQNREILAYLSINDKKME